MANHVAKPYIIFWSQLGIISPKIQGLCFTFQATPCCFSPNVMQFVQFHHEFNIFIWVKEHFWSTLGTWNQTSVTVFLLYSRDFLKFGHEVLTECGEPHCKPFV